MEFTSQSDLLFTSDIYLLIIVGYSTYYCLSIMAENSYSLSFRLFTYEEQIQVYIIILDNFIYIERFYFNK